MCGCPYYDNTQKERKRDGPKVRKRQSWTVQESYKRGSGSGKNVRNRNRKKGGGQFITWGGVNERPVKRTKTRPKLSKRKECTFRGGEKTDDFSGPAKGKLKSGRGVGQQRVEKKGGTSKNPRGQKKKIEGE